MQAAHSTIEFQHEHPELSKEWLLKSRYLVFLSVKNEQELLELKSKFKKHNLIFSGFNEPDIGDQLTAITVEPSEKARNMCKKLPLLLKEFSNVKKNC